ncbi:MAG: NADP-dependent oxidoreductase [Firmicutes bacterium]|nr:NADP-dependent oxidoreductase [Bacillota bacterium]
MPENRVVYFVKRPVGMVTAASFEVRNESIPPLEEADQLLVESVYASVDPYMRGRMSEGKSYAAPFALDTPMQGGMVGQVADPGSTDLHRGDWVFGVWQWGEFARVARRAVRRLDPALPPTAALHVLGLTGLTAYIGLTKFGRPVASEQLVVSGAAGSVGSIVGQIGRILGLRTVGIAGTQEKCEWLTRAVGFDAAVNYQDPRFPDHLRDALEAGVDVYFDNVGGPVTDRVMRYLNPHARIAICGQISSYNQLEATTSRPLFADLLISRAEASGFIIGDHERDYPAALAQLGRWYSEGKLIVEETITEGFDRWIEAFIGLFHGANRGKAIVKVR